LSALEEPHRSLAATAIASGQFALSRSIRLHRPRGAFCCAGWCQQCQVVLPDGSRVLACQTPPSAGDLGQLGKHDPLRVIGRLAEHLRPWFWERHGLGSGRLSQIWLDLLRRLSGAPPLPTASSNRSGEWKHESCDVLIVGGGRSGLIAAYVLANTGRKVVLVEVEELGGLARFLPQQAPALPRLIEQARRAGAELREQTSCLGLYDGATQALVLSPNGPSMVEISALVIAAGAYDRLPAFAGNDLPGIIGGRAFLRLAAAGAVPPGLRVGLYGDATFASLLHASAAARGLEFSWAAGPGDLPDLGAEMHLHCCIRQAWGSDRITALEIEPGGKLACDILVLALSQPAYELQMQAGRQALLMGDPPTVRTAGPALLPLIEVGAATGAAVSDAFDRQIEIDLAAWMADFDTETVSLPSQEPPKQPDPRALLCLCEDVRVGDCEQAIADGFDNIELLKRRTGAGTGPCQGKLCHAELMACLARAGRLSALPTVRPLLRPVRLDAFAGADDGR
jgi:sarcosine oxidase subunit alpha